MEDENYIHELTTLRYNSLFHSSVKLFDFGLARVMPKIDNPNIDVFDMSDAGTPR